jgi:hypothetical protein
MSRTLVRTLLYVCFNSDLTVNNISGQYISRYEGGGAGKMLGTLQSISFCGKSCIMVSSKIEIQCSDIIALKAATNELNSTQI